MPAEKSRLAETLLSQRLISKEKLNAALDLQRQTSSPLSSILVSMGFISEDMLLRVLAAEMGVAPCNLSKEPPEPEAVALLSKEVCEQYQMLPIRVSGELLTLAMRNPLDFEAIDLARNLSKHRIEPVLANAERLMRAIDERLAVAKSSKHIDTLVGEAIKESAPKAERHEKQVLNEANTRPVVGLVNQILSDAIRLGASDTHIEPRANRTEVRYRVDGQMLKVRDLPLDLLPMIAARLKIMAELDVVETRQPQDGRTTVEIDGRNVDLRISCLPNYHGQRVVLRILDRAASLHKLDGLGFTPDQLGLFRTLISKPYGLLLVTGPTGSGKTTTLYAALAELKKVTNNIMTAEDPVEYDIDGISQSQINEKIGLTFPVLLRSILRQDPDIVLVGEIRDRETAETAIRASLTGHLVLSTLHCNDAPSAIPRLIDIGVDPYLLSTCLMGVTAQRLVRTVCQHCKVQDQTLPMPSNGADRLGQQILPTWKGKGCPRCAQIGFKGRTGINELMAISPKVADAIAEQSGMEKLRSLAAEDGFEPMQIDALRKVMEGRTTVEEVRRHVELTGNSSVSQLRFAA
jgi:type IV pilus assembly protein PilB